MKRFSIFMLLIAIVFVLATPAFAQEETPEEPTITDVVESVWTIVACAHNVWEELTTTGGESSYNESMETSMRIQAETNRISAMGGMPQNGYPTGYIPDGR